MTAAETIEKIIEAMAKALARKDGCGEERISIMIAGGYSLAGASFESYRDRARAAFFAQRGIVQVVPINETDEMRIAGFKANLRYQEGLADSSIVYRATTGAGDLTKEAGE